MPLNWQMDTNPDCSAMDTNNNLVKIVDLEVIRKSAEQVVCYREDMAFAPGRSNLMTMQPPPSSAKELSNVVHASKATRDALHALADDRGLKIEFDKEESALLWLQGGGVSARQNRLSIFTFVRRPIHREDTAVESLPLTATGGPLAEEPPFEGIVERPVADGQFVQSSFKCQVGGILILEGGERLRTRNPGDIEHRDLCMVINLHPTRRQ